MRLTPEQWFWAALVGSVLVYCALALYYTKEDPVNWDWFDDKKKDEVPTFKMVVPPVPRVSRACGDNTPHVCKCGPGQNKPTPLAMKLGKEVKDEDAEE